MFKLLAFSFFLIPSIFGFTPLTNSSICTCPGISNLQKTGQSSSSFTYTWSNSNATQYKVWYTRQEDGYTSGFFYTTNPSFNFTGLSNGHYTFYFQTVCGGESSGYIGIEDTIGA